VASESIVDADPGSPSDEHLVLLEGCGLLDRSERGKLALTGPDALEFLDGQVTNELRTLLPGEGRYAAFLTHKGKMLGDLRVLALGEDRASPPTEVLLDSERPALQALFDMIRRFKVGYRVEVHKRTLESGMISLIGPRAEEVAGAVSLPPEEHSHTPLLIDDLHAIAVRTDVGLDLIGETSDAAALSAALVRRGATVIGEEAAECLRIERGIPRFGIDLDETVIPQEAGLNERAVSFTKGCYVGQETVARLHYKGRPNRHLRGVRLSEPAALGDELVLSERVVGRLGSVATSPELGPIALALVRREAEPGAAVGVGALGASGEIVELPFAGRA
jgi:folate-binding protein YgfZ